MAGRVAHGATWVAAASAASTGCCEAAQRLNSAEDSLVAAKPMLVKHEVYHDGRYWCARGIGVDIFTQGRTMDELMANNREAVEVHFEEERKPK